MEIICILNLAKDNLVMIELLLQSMYRVYIFSFCREIDERV